MQATGNMVFAPSFSGLSVSTADDSSGKTVYALSGFDLHRLRVDCDQCVTRDEPYLQILVGNKPIKASDVGFTVATDNLAYLSIDKQTLANAKAIRLRLSADPSGDAASSVEWACRRVCNFVQNPVVRFPQWAPVNSRNCRATK
jgi:hypothetical protein